MLLTRAFKCKDRVAARPGQSEAGRLLSIVASVVNVIRESTVLIITCLQPLHTYVYMYACWEIRQLLAEGWRFPFGTPVSTAIKTDRHDMT